MGQTTQLLTFAAIGLIIGALLMVLYWPRAADVAPAIAPEGEILPVPTPGRT